MQTVGQLVGSLITFIQQDYPISQSIIWISKTSTTLLSLAISTEIILAWFRGTTYPIYMRYAMVAFDDSMATHVGTYNPIPSGYWNAGAIAIGY